MIHGPVPRWLAVHGLRTADIGSRYIDSIAIIIYRHVNQVYAKLHIAINRELYIIGLTISIHTIQYTRRISTTTCESTKSTRLNSKLCKDLLSIENSKIV
jgi:hypothetical protein